MTKVKIAIEYLIDTVTNYFDYYEDYVKASHVWKYGDPEKRCDQIHRTDRWQQSQWETINDIGYILNLTKEQMERLFVCAKAVRNWRKRTKYMYCMSSNMKQNIAYYLFGKEEDIDWYIPINNRQVEFI